MSTVATATPVTLDRYELPGNLAGLAALASTGQVTLKPHEIIRTTDGRVYHWTGSALDIVSAPVHHGTVADVAALDGIYLLPNCTRGVHPGDTAYVTAAGCEYRVTSGINATAIWAACTTLPTIPTTPSEVGADPAGTAATAVSAHNTSPDSHADIRTLIADRALIEHQHARTDLPWITDQGAALLTAASASAQRTALGMTAWAVAPWTDGTTSDIPEGTQLYFTTARADARIAAQKGQAEGIMPLDSGGKAPLAYIPDALIGQVKFKGVWDAATNSPALPSATASMGYYYVTSVAGSFGGINYEVGDWCISDGSTWGKVDNSDAITSFAGRVGAILPIASDYSSFYLGVSAQAADSAMLGGQLPSHYEAAIGNPSANGYLLSSTTAGVRSWVAPYSHPATHAQGVIDSSTGWITTALAGKQAAGSFAGSSTPGGAATTSLACTGNAATATTAASCTGNSATATTASSCSGNAATATALATARLINGTSFNGSSDVIVSKIYDANYIRIVNPDGGTLLTNGTRTGAIAIRLPNGFSNTMLSFSGFVYDYSTNKSFTFSVHGYCYENGTWGGTSAQVSGFPEVNLGITVRFGRLADLSPVVYIGELDSAWTYPQVSVNNVFCAWAGFSHAWTAGWQITFESNAFMNVWAVATNCQVGYRPANAFTGAKVIGGTTYNFVNGLLVS